MADLNFFERYLKGNLYDAYRYFGPHRVIKRGKEGYLFRVYAPMAKEVSLIGDFNGWDALKGQMGKMDYRGLYEIFVPGVKPGDRYKFHILGCDGFYKDKQDPFAFADQVREMSCSIVEDISALKIEDQAYCKTRDRNFDKPMSIYEFHMGTWKRRPDGSQYTYSELAQEMIPYLKDMGYTHVEALPIFAYPNDKSWGYQALGFYAVDERWGNLFEFAKFVQKMHEAGIGIIMDFVPVHFAIDSFGLEKFDGSCVYEYSNEHEFTEWGTKSFDLGKDPVRSFLISALMYFADVFHIDGFRFDAVSNIIYWDGNSDKGENQGAIEFVKRANQALHAAHDDLMMIAEDSSSYGHVTKGFNFDGLGFDYKWDLGWMNDTLKYYSKDPVYKKYCHNQLTFSMAYFYSENFLLPLSHDEVVHMKGSIVNKMWGSYDNKFALVRNLYAYMFAHPGKKLSFMGNELAEFDEWKEWQPLAFNVLDYPKHQGVHRLFRDLNHIYLAHDALYAREYDPARFSWIMADNSDQSVYAFYRESDTQCIVCVFNMTPNFYWDYDLGVPYQGTYEEILNTDKAVYGGWNQYNGAVLETYGNGIHNQKAKLTIKLPSFGAVYLCHKKELPKEEEKTALFKEPERDLAKNLKIV